MLTLKSFLIICPLVFLGGFVDAIGGGGGLISLPAYLLAGVPTHMAIATNKLSSASGTAVTTFRFFREKLINLKLALPGIAASLLGSLIGARLSLLTDEKLLGYIILPVLFAAACLVFNRQSFGRSYPEEEIAKRTYAIATLSAFVIGMYDGFYGPGTGTFLIVALNVFAHLNLKKANAQAKVINLTTNITSLTVFFVGKQVIWQLGLAGAVCGILGNYLGSGLAIKKSEKITRPIILCVLALLFCKVIFSY